MHVDWMRTFVACRNHIFCGCNCHTHPAHMHDHTSELVENNKKIQGSRGGWEILLTAVQGRQVSNCQVHRLAAAI